MKFLRQGLFFFAAIAGVTPVWALYVGNPAEPENVEEGLFLPDDVAASFKLGYQGDFLLDRKLKGTGNGKGRVDNFNALFNQGVLTVGLMERFEVYTSLGAMNAKFTNRPSIDNKIHHFETLEQFAWGAGARVMLLNWGQFGLGADGKYQAAYPHMKYATVNGVAFSSKAKMTYQEWQISLGSYYHIGDLFTPYVALDYSMANVRIKGLKDDIFPKRSFSMKSRQRLGLALGCSLSSPKVIDLTLEVKLVDEQAIFLAGNIKL